MSSRAEITTRYARAYVKAAKKDKGKILDQVVEVRTRSAPTVPAPKALSGNRYRSPDCTWAVRVVTADPGITFIPGYNAAHQVLADG